jgi:hypothetical protein
MTKSLTRSRRKIRKFPSHSFAGMSWLMVRRFASFVQYLDSYKCATYLYLTSAGFKALDEAKTSAELKDAKQEEEADSEDELAGATEEG